jgi:hypothetical protein
MQNADFGGKSVLDVDKINIPKEELLRNRTIAKHFMFPEVANRKSQENKKLQDIQQFFSYLNNQLAVELNRFRDWKTKRYIRAMTELANLQIELLTEVCHD